MSEPIHEDRLRNTRAWAAARIGQLSGAEVIVGAIDELLELREKLRFEQLADAFHQEPQRTIVDGALRKLGAPDNGPESRNE